MKRFILKLALALLPFLLYAAVFAAFEPYNYWGLKEAGSGSWTTPLARARAFLRNPSGNLILGDSRMNHFDLDAVEDLTGDRYASLSTGGQALNLTRELYDWAAGKVTIENVVLDASFYQLRHGDVSASAGPALYMAEHPLEYMTTRDYVIEAFGSAWKAVRRPKAGSSPARPAAASGKYRPDLVAYATEKILPSCQDYSLSRERLADICYVLSDAKKNGVDTLVVLPPVQESIWDLVIKPLNLEGDMQIYRSVLKRYSKVYDMEWLSGFSQDQSVFDDGFHFSRNGGYGRFTEAIFTGQADFLRILPAEDDWMELQDAVRQRRLPGLLQVPENALLQHTDLIAGLYAARPRLQG